MNRLTGVKGLVFDYGGTIDTNGKHWSEVLWNQYCELNILIEKEAFKEAYVHGERTLALQPLIKPNYDFKKVLLFKATLQIDFLIQKGVLAETSLTRQYPQKIAEGCYAFVEKTLETTRPIIEKLSKQYNLVLVSNFYGNMCEVLKNFGLLCFFKEIIESSVVGVRKPDPGIFILGVKALQLQAKEIVVIGDSFSKDILPASKAGCRTVWLKGEGWEEETDQTVADRIIDTLAQLPEWV